MPSNCSDQKNPHHSLKYRTPNFCEILHPLWKLPQTQSRPNRFQPFHSHTIQLWGELNLASGINREIYSLRIHITTTAPTCFLGHLPWIGETRLDSEPASFKVLSGRTGKGHFIHCVTDKLRTLEVFMTSYGLDANRIVFLNIKHFFYTELFLVNDFFYSLFASTITQKQKRNLFAEINQLVTWNVVVKQNFPLSLWSPIICDLFSC